MKFTATQENIAQAIHLVSRVAQKNTNLPILENILIRAQTSRIEVMATNLEIGIRYSFRAKIEKEGEIAVPAKIIEGFLSNIPSENIVECEVKENICIFSSGKYTASIIGISSEEFPIVPSIKGEKEEEFISWKIPVDKFKKNITKSIVCVSSNDIRAEFSGVYTRFSSQDITMVSTDSFRLLELHFGGVVGSLEEQKAIIPLRALSEILRCISQQIEKEMKCVFHNGQLFVFFGEDLQLVTQLISGTFPDYTQIIPSQFRTSIDLSVKDMLRAVKLAEVFSQSSGMEVVMSIDVENKKVKIGSRGAVVGNNSSELEVKMVHGDDQEIILNAKYVSDVLGFMEEGIFRILLVNESSPVVFGYPEGKEALREGFRYILMPIRK